MHSKFRFEDARRGRSILNDTVDLHVQATDHHRNIAGIGIRQHSVNVTGIWRRNPATFAEIRSVQIPATNLAGIRPSDRIWPERPYSSHLARHAGFRPSGRIWPESQIPAKLPESSHFRRNPAIPNSDSEFRPLSRILVILAGIR